MNAEEIKKAMREYVKQQNEFDDRCKSVVGRVAFRNLKQFVHELECEAAEAEAEFMGYTPGSQEE